MNWLARLKNQNGPEPHPTKPTEPGFVGFVAPSPGHIQKFEGADLTGSGAAEATLGLVRCSFPAELKKVEDQFARALAANEAESDPDRWCWPHSSAMNTGEIDRMVSRVELFVNRGLNLIDATLLADKLVIRDRDGDDRRLCLECSNLSGGTGKRCGAWRRAGLVGPGVPAGWPEVAQRCPAFAGCDISAQTPTR